MTQYIDKDALVAEIDRRIKELREVVAELGNYAGYECGAVHDIYLYKDIRSFVNTLEVKEVDFETAFAASIDHFDEKNNYGQWPESDLRTFAEHFFELGLKAQKGE